MVGARSRAALAQWEWQLAQQWEMEQQAAAAMDPLQAQIAAVHLMGWAIQQQAMEQAAPALMMAATVRQMGEAQVADAQMQIAAAQMLRFMNSGM